MSKKITRRDFLHGAAAGAVGVAAMGLVGCSQQSTPTPTTESVVTPAPTPTAASVDTAQSTMTPQMAMANLNPQDYDYTGNTITDFTNSTLFSEWQLGPLSLSNRIVKSAAGSAYLSTSKSEEIIAKYVNWAKGGVGFIWVEDFLNLYTNFPPAYKTKTADNFSLSELTDAIHKEGGRCGYQLYMMSAKFSGFDPATAEEFACAHADDLTLEEIGKVQEDFINAATYIYNQGFDAVEINAAGNNIGQAFLSRNRNARDDEYGPQSIENRTRFVAEIIQGIKDNCGSDFPVQVLINGIEENDIDLGDDSLYTTVEENAEIAKELEAAGADSLHVRLGPAGMHVAEFASDLYFTGYGINGTTGFGTQYDFSRHFQGKLISNHSGCGMMLDIAAEIKKAVSIPVGAVTYMDPAHAPDFFESALKDGKADFLLMTRPLIVDPEYVNKLREGRIDEIAPCTRCMHCHFDYDEDGNFYEHCRVNASHMRAYEDQMPEGYDPLPAEVVKNVMVIGGGPAGMEAARISAQRGHTVTLYEKNGYLGGLLPFASAVKGPHENLDSLNTYLIRQLEVKGVTVVTGQEVDADFITQQAPDVAILAVGGKRDTLGLTGTGGTNIISIDDVMTADIGDEVTVVGSDLQAVDVALYLLAQGKHVTIVSSEPIGKLEKGHSSWVKAFTKPMLFARGTRVWPIASITNVGDGEITINGEAGIDTVIKCDTVIEAMDMLPDTSILDGVSGIDTYAIGDCNAPFNIAEAIASGNLTARKI